MLFDVNSPHFHALYGEYNGVFQIDSLEMMEGDLATRAQKMVKEWTSLYQDDLLDVWKTQKIQKTSGPEIRSDLWKYFPEQKMLRH